MDLLKQEVKAPLKPGIGRFEALLEIVGLSGAVSEHARRAILELSQVRNVIVHRDGIADARFVEKCPWLKMHIGEPVKVTAHSYRIYQTAVDWYILELSERWKTKYSVSFTWREQDYWIELIQLKEKLATLLVRLQEGRSPENLTTD